MKSKNKILNLRSPIGATVAEYMIMLILVAIFCVGVVRVFGGTISTKLHEANDGVKTMEAQPSSAANGVGGEAAGVAGKSGKTGKSAKSKSGKLGSKSSGKAVPPGSKKTVVAEAPNSGPGINPIVLFIALGLIGLLIYVMVANKKGS